MSTTRKLFAIAPLALLAACQGETTAPSPSPAPGTATKVEALALAAGDLSVAKVARDLSLANAVTLEAKPLEASWVLPRTNTIAVAPHRESTKGFRKLIEARELAAGVMLPFTVTKPAVRISPASATKMTIDARALIIDDLAGHTFTGGTAMENIAGAAAIEATGAPATPGMAAFRLRPEAVKGGRVVIRLPAAKDFAPTDQILIDVMEKDSDTSLGLQAKEGSLVAGDKVSFDFEWARNAGTLVATETYAWLRSPTGVVTTIPVSALAAGFHGEMLIDTGSARPGELWEIEVDATAKLDDGRLVKRTVKTAVSVALPSARVAGLTKAAVAEQDLNLSVDVEVGSKGRYMFQAVVFGTADDGSLVPAITGQSAAMFDPGTHTLSLHIKGDQLKQAGVHAPFEVRDVRLVDQSRLGLLHRQARALVIR